MKILLFNLAIFTFCIISCNKNINVSYQIYESDSIQHLDLNSYLDNDTYNVSDILDSTKLVFLETNDNSLIGNIYQTIVTDSRIFIYDDYQRTGVAVFDNNGKFVKRIVHGNGPGEINFVRSIQYDKYNKELIILAPHALMKFDMDGNYLETINFDSYYPYMIGCTEKSYLFSKGFDEYDTQSDTYNYSLIVTNKNLEITQLLLPYNNVTKKMITSNSGFEYNQNIIVREPYVDSLFIFKNDSLFTYKTFDISSKEIDLNQFQSIVDFFEYLNKGEESKGIIYSDKYIENSTHIIFGLLYKNTQYPIYINKTNYHAVSGLQCAFESDKNISICFPKNTYNDWFYEIRRPDPFIINNAITSDRYISKQDIDKLKKMKEDDNPFIMFYKLKNF